MTMVNRGAVQALDHVWDVNLLEWVPETQPTGGGGGGTVTQGAGGLSPWLVTGPLTDTQLRASAVPISATALPLPTDAATQTTLAQIKAKTDNLDVALSSRTKPADSQHVTVDNASVAVTGTFFQATQPVSGTFFQATQPVSIASMPSTPVTGTFFQATQPVIGTVGVSNMIPAVETGLATSAKQDTANTSLASIDAKLTNPLPVSGTVATGGLTDAQLRATAVPVSGTFYQATQPVSATSLPLPTNAATSSLQTQPGVDIGDVTVNNGSGASAVNVQDGGNSITVDGVFFQTTQPVSLVSLPALAAGSAVIGHVIADSGSTTVVTGNVTVVQGTATNLKAQAESYQGGTAVSSSNPLQVSLANTGANATAVKVNGSAVTQPVSVASLPLPSDAATASIQTNGTQTTQITDGSFVVGVATDVDIQEALRVYDAGGIAHLNTIKTNTTPLVTAGGGGYMRQDSTASIAKESGGNLATVKTNTDPLVVAAAGGYVRQDSTGTIAKESGGNLATIATNSGLTSTAAKQDTGNASLASIDGKITAVNTGAVIVSSSALPSNAAEETGGNLDTLAAVDFALESDGNLEAIADNTADLADTQIVMLACLRELKLLRQSFQDWTGLGEPRYDAEIRIQ